MSILRRAGVRYFAWIPPLEIISENKVPALDPLVTWHPPYDCFLAPFLSRSLDTIYSLAPSCSSFMSWASFRWLTAASLVCNRIYAKFYLLAVLSSFTSALCLTVKYSLFICMRRCVLQSVDARRDCYYALIPQGLHIFRPASCIKGCCQEFKRDNRAASLQLRPRSECLAAATRFNLLIIIIF